MTATPTRELLTWIDARPRTYREAGAMLVLLTLATGQFRMTVAVLAIVALFFAQRIPERQPGETAAAPA